MTDYDIQTDKDRPYRDADVLGRLYHDERLNQDEIADVLNADSSTIWRWMDKLGVETRDESEAQVAHPKLLNESWLRKHYHDERMSITEISEELGTSRMPVYRALERFDIETHSRGYHTEVDRPNIKTGKYGYVKAHAYDKEYKNSRTVRIHRLVAVAEHGYDAVAGKEVHHRNGIPWDNRPDNLEIMTKAEHARHHFHERGGMRSWQGGEDDG